MIDDVEDDVDDDEDDDGGAGSARGRRIVTHSRTNTAVQHLYCPVVTLHSINSLLHCHLNDNNSCQISSQLGR